VVAKPFSRFTNTLNRVTELAHANKERTTSLREQTTSLEKELSKVEARQKEAALDLSNFEARSVTLSKEVVNTVTKLVGKALKEKNEAEAIAQTEMQKAAQVQRAVDEERLRRQQEAKGALSDVENLVHFLQELSPRPQVQPPAVQSLAQMQQMRMQPMQPSRTMMAPQPAVAQPSPPLPLDPLAGNPFYYQEAQQPVLPEDFAPPMGA